MTDEVVVQEQPQNALALIAQATADSNVDPEKLRALLDVKQDWERGEARKSFAAALAKFQAEAPIIAKLDTAHNKQYARMDRIWREIRPLMTECGLAVVWTKVGADDTLCHIEGMLTHKDGHSVDLVHDIPVPRAITGQNESQRAGSAETYAKRYALCAALGIVTGEDDDANAGIGECVTDEQAKELRKLVAATGSNEAKFLAWCGSEGYAEIPAQKFEAAHRMLSKKSKVAS